MNARGLRDFARGAREGRALAGRERLDPAALRADTDRRVDAFVREAVRRSPLQRERLGRLVGAGPVRLDELPPMTKAQMMEGFDRLVTDPRLRRDELLAHLDGLTEDALYLGEFRVMATSGSSGMPGVFVYDREGWAGMVAQFLRYSALLGNRPRIPRRRVAAVTGTAAAHMSRRLAGSVDVGLHRVLSLAVDMPLPELVARLNDYRPDLLAGYPSILAPLAEEQLAGRLRIAPDTISASSEMLTAATRERIAEAFGVQPFDFYATTEGLWGCECDAHDGIHLFEDCTVVENVDEEGRPVRDGERGAKLLVTNLVNPVQPLIRLELADSVVLDDRPCACGRTLRRIRSIEGRSDDVVRLEGGRVTVPPLQFAAVGRDPGVREFQVVQRGDALRLRLVLRGEDDGVPERVRRDVADRLRQIGVAEPDVTVEVCSALERLPGGKLQMVVADR